MSREIFDNNQERLSDFIKENGVDNLERQIEASLKEDYRTVINSLDDQDYGSFENSFENYKNSLIKSSQKKVTDKIIQAKKDLGSKIVIHILEDLFDRIKKQESQNKEDNLILLKFIGTYSLYHGLVETPEKNKLSEGIQQLGDVLRENYWKSIDINIKNGSVQNSRDLVEKFMVAYHKTIIVNIMKSRTLTMKKTNIQEINRQMLKSLVVEVLSENSGLGYSPLSDYDRETSAEEENPEDVSREFDSFLQHYDRDKTNSAALELAKTLCSSEEGLEAFRDMLELSKQLPELQKELVILMRNDETS